MISFLRRYRKVLFIAVIAIFLIATFVGLGGYLFTSRDTSSAVASVGPAKIPYSRYIARVNQYAEVLRSRGTEVNDEMIKELKRAMLQEMIVDELLVSKASEMGIMVADEELARDIRNTPAFQRDGNFSQEAYFFAVRRSFGDTPEAYEGQRRLQIKTAKFKQLLYHSAKLTPAEVDAAFKRAQDSYAKEHKGSLKGFTATKEAVAGQEQQQKALELINYYLRQLAGQIQIVSYLEQRESGT
ncbi:MAG: hypothetical protein A3J74_09935 [Elusimicrobia bacterium RIFCSPHIGHO2_02_FULL_57_9]|nr:MAG: hypothetical protein A3J74_09935 [Elusimicrobia bacterium RIFCSPHIGHO2_02_FULL_57_9]